MTPPPHRAPFVIIAFSFVAFADARGGALDARELPQDDGYRGIWYSNQPSGDEYRYKYSGGFATYPQQHHPIALYSEEAEKTFFVYGGTRRGRNELLHMVSYYDHRTGLFPRPRILLDKETSDAHDNPTLALDGEGRLWVFSNAHGTARRSWIHRSTEPYSIRSFERVLETNFSYGQPWHLPDRGFLFLHTRYSGGRRLFWQTSQGGREWSEPHLLARVEKGHYQVSWRYAGRVGTAFNYHPEPVGLNARTNLYYLETADGGASWRAADGSGIETPIVAEKNPALARDYRAEGLLVYLKDLNFDGEGRPVILHLTSRDYRSGPHSGPRVWRTARWTGADWEVRRVTTSDHNYDHGSLYIEDGGTWRIIAPTAPGPEPHTTGGDVVLWVSDDRGGSWRKVKQLTRARERNHTYVRRPVNAHPDFYALWADGKTLEPSPSSLYFTSRDGERVFRLPERMEGATAPPEIAW